MLRLRLDYLPQGSVQGTQLLAEMTLTNDGTGTMAHGNYDVVLHDAEGTERTVRVERFSRDKGAWALVQAAMEALAH